jgi:hypothetical protein
MPPMLKNDTYKFQPVNIEEIGRAVQYCLEN